MAHLDSLVVYRKQLGDVLLLQPALSKLAGSGSVGVVTRPGFADMISLMPGNVRLASRWSCRAREVYCLEAGRGALVPAALNIGARRHLRMTRNEARWWHPLFFSKISVHPGGDAYRAALFFEMLTGAAAGFTPPRLNLPPEDWLPAGLPASYGVIHPTAAWQRKTWAPEKWVEALGELGGELGDDLPWVISSGPAAWERALASKLAAGLGPRAIDLGGRTSLRQYLALLSRAKLTLCVDGSASHLSAAFGKPTLTLFGPTNPVHWHWPSPNTPHLSATDYSFEPRPPVEAIPVRAVGEAIRQLLGKING